MGTSAGSVPPSALPAQHRGSDEPTETTESLDSIHRPPAGGCCDHMRSMVVHKGSGRYVARARLAAVCVILSLGFGLGLGLPAHGGGTAGGSSSCPAVLSVSVSAVLGWTYFAAWSFSFYPQAILNCTRRSVAGFSYDFALLNVIGYVCYSTYNVALLTSAEVRAQYARASAGGSPAVKVNDAFFALHAAGVSSFTLGQVFLYDKGDQRFSWPAKVAAAGIPSAAVAGALLAGVPSVPWLGWLEYLNALALVKLGITLVKYVPQVWLNYKRRSTDGWNVDNVLLDFTGGVLSLTQLLLDAGCAHDWTKVSGDPVKFGLGLFSIIFDIVFILQHYVWYREDQIQSSNGSAAAPERAGEPMTTPLLLERWQSGSVRAAPLGHAAQ